MKLRDFARFGGYKSAPPERKIFDVQNEIDPADGAAGSDGRFPDGSGSFWRSDG